MGPDLYGKNAWGGVERKNTRLKVSELGDGKTSHDLKCLGMVGFSQITTIHVGSIRDRQEPYHQYRLSGCGDINKSFYVME